MTNPLLEAIAKCLRDDAKIECESNYQLAQREGEYYSVCTGAYGGGRPKNLVSVFTARELVTIYIPRINSLNDFQQRYGFPAARIMPDNTTMTQNKPYHSVEVSASHFSPLIKGGNVSMIRRFLVSAVREALVLRGISPAGRSKLRQTASLVNPSPIPPKNHGVPQGVKATTSDDPHPDFTRALYEGYKRARIEAHYNAPYFLEMLKERYGYDTAINLICLPKPSIGFTHLWERKRLDLTVEAFALLPEWSPIFQEEVLRAARYRLEQ